MDNKDKIRELTINLINQSNKDMLESIDRVLRSGAIDVDAWDENINPMILPKCIASAILLNESTQYLAKGTSFEKQVAKEVKNISNFL